MKINEDNILNDMGKIYSLTNNPSYSKDKIYNDDVARLNHLYSITYGKYFNLPNNFNSYYERFAWRSYNKDYYEYASLIIKYQKYYLEFSKNYLKILEDNNFFYNYLNCKRTYSDLKMKELLLDFFNDKGVDKLKIVKSKFSNDEERVSTSSLENLDYVGFCTITDTNIKPYVVVDGSKDKNTLTQLVDFAHEFGHSIEAYYMQNRYNKFYRFANLPFSEVASMFYELEFLRYMQRNRINIKDTINAINDFHSFTSSFLEGLVYSDTKEIVEDDEKFISSSDDFYVNEERDIIRPFKKESDKDGLEYWLEFEFYRPLIYGFGSYLAFYLSELKKQDPKEFNKAWNYYLSTRTLMNYEEIFNLFGLNVDEFVSGKLIEPTIKQDLENYRKQLIRKK